MWDRLKRWHVSFSSYPMCNRAKCWVELAGGTLRDLCNLHNVGDKSASTSAQAKQAKTNPPAPQANSSAAQGQAALETLLPSVDTHAQWFQRTYGNAPQGPMPAPGQQLNDVFNVPLPTYSADPVRHYLFLWHCSACCLGQVACSRMCMLNVML